MDTEVTSWEELVSALTTCQDFLEHVVDQTPFNRKQITGVMHAARLLGHVTDALLLAGWIMAIGRQASGKPPL